MKTATKFKATLGTALAAITCMVLISGPDGGLDRLRALVQSLERDAAAPDTSDPDRRIPFDRPTDEGRYVELHVQAPMNTAAVLNVTLTVISEQRVDRKGWQVSHQGVDQILLRRGEGEVELTAEVTLRATAPRTTQIECWFKDYGQERGKSSGFRNPKDPERKPVICTYKAHA